MLDRPDDPDAERDRDVDVDVDWNDAKQAARSGSPRGQPLQEVPREASVERFLTERIWDWGDVKRAAPARDGLEPYLRPRDGLEPRPRAILEPPTLLLWRFAPEEREHLAKHLRERLPKYLRDDRYDDQTAAILDGVEGATRLWRVLMADEAERQEQWVKVAAMFKAMNRLQGRARVGRGRIERYVAGSDLAPMVLRVMACGGVRIARGRHKHGWLEEFFVDLSAIVGARYPNVLGAIQLAAREQAGPRPGRRYTGNSIHTKRLKAG